VSALAIEDVTSRDSGRIRLALEAMATRFELVIDGPDPVRLRAAGEEALDEILRLDRQLSFYRSTSDVTWINVFAADDAVRVEPGLFALLQRCQALSAATGGAFDVTVAPLMRAWRFVADSGAVPDEAALTAARQSVGYVHMRLDPDTSTIAFAKRGMAIDLGAAGKGYAVDQAMHILRAHGVTRALLHGRTSSVHTLGASPDGRRWQIGWKPPGGGPRTFGLRDSALSVSAVHGKAFVADGRTYGHVMDPRTGLATASAQAAAVTGPGSLECDALSTALSILGPEWLPTLREAFPGYDGEVV